jgi:hypothetical protein
MTMFQTIGLEALASLTIKTLVDTLPDILLLDEGPAIRRRSTRGHRAWPRP